MAGDDIEGSTVPNADTYEDRISDSRTQIFASGGYGGDVRYDGEGGPMVKEGGPMDRIFVLRERGELGGNHGLDIVWGRLRVETGPLAGEVEVRDRESKDDDTTVVYTFEGNDDEDAIELEGGILDVEGRENELEVATDSTLFRGTVEPSEMKALTGDATDRRPNLPYTAFSTEFEVHPFIAKRFGLDHPVDGVAVMGWCKPQQPAGSFRGENISGRGVGFSTQQHLGSLRIFVDG